MSRKDETHFRGDHPSSTPPFQADDGQPIDSVPLYRNFKVVIPLFLAVIGIAVIAWRYYVTNRDFVSTDDAMLDGNRVSVSAKILGRIDSLAVEEGDKVTRGQILVWLGDADLRSQEIQAQASLALASESVTLAKVGLERAKSDFDRASTQYKGNVITGEQLDHARSDLESARAKTAIAVAQVRTAEAQLGVVETQLRNTRIESPMDGVVSKRWALPGDVVQPGQAVFSVYDIGHLWVSANFEETHLSAIRLNDKVAVRVDAYPGREFWGTVELIGSNTAAQFSLIPPNNAAGNFTKITQRVPVKIAIEPPTGSDAVNIRLLPGMSAEVKVRIH